MSGVRVLVVDDHALVRRGLCTLLEFEDGVEVVGEAADGAEALARVGAVPTDVVLADARMPRMDGVALVRALAERHPSVGAILLSTFDDDEYVLGGLSAGARGYLLKDVHPDRLVDAIRRVHAGQTVLDPSVSARVVAGLAAAGRAPDPVLSAREQQVADLVATGSSNREIARALTIGEGTVKNHLSAVLRKLGLRDRVQLAVHLNRTRP